MKFRRLEWRRSWTCARRRQRRLVTTLMAHRVLRFDVLIPDQVIVFDPSIQNQ